MGNETRHYFGAYLEVDVNKVEKTKSVRVCQNEHYNQMGDFCSVCGSKVKVQEKSFSEYPTWIDDIIGEEWLDVLAVITPPKMYNTGKIIAVGNSDPRGEWLWLDRWVHDIETKTFPTENEIRQMIHELETNYERVIVALKDSPIVNRVTVKAGYVLDTEY